VLWCTTRCSLFMLALGSISGAGLLCWAVRLGEQYSKRAKPTCSSYTGILGHRSVGIAKPRILFSNVLDEGRLSNVRLGHFRHRCLLPIYLHTWVALYIHKHSYIHIHTQLSPTRLRPNVTFWRAVLKLFFERPFNAFWVNPVLSLTFLTSVSRSHTLCSLCTLLC
jgi:hypothetical protein